MRSLYKAHLELEKGTKLADVAGSIHEWTPGCFPDKVTLEDFVKGVKIEDSKIVLETIRTNGESGELFGVSLKHPDRKNAHLSWLTTLACGEDNGIQTVCVDLQGGFEDNTICPVDLSFFRPRIVPELLRKHGSKERGNVSYTYQIVNFDDIGNFTTQFIQSPDRKIPVIYVSRSKITERPVIDVERTASFLAGIAHLIVGDTKYADMKLRDFVGNTHSCYDGAVRLYWPVQGSGLYSRFFSRDFVGKFRAQVPEVLMKEVARFSVGMNMPINFDLIRRSHLKEVMKSLDKTSDYASMAEKLMDENYALEKARKIDEQVLAAEREENRQLTFRINQLELALAAQKSAVKPEVEEQINYGSVADAVNGYEARNPDAPVTILPRAKRAADNCCFNDPNKVYGALDWIASTYVQAKRGKLTGTSLEDSAKNTLGMEFVPHQSEVTMGMWPAEYTVDYRGKKVKLKEHLKTGKRNPQSSVRIAFFFDDKSSEAVVGFVGYHQTNKHS